MGLGHARSFKGLVVYQKARELSRMIFEISERFPAKEDYSLTDQVRRSSRSIGAQIAECWAKRRYPRSFVLKLTDANGEMMETQHWVETAHDCAYVSPESARTLDLRCIKIGKMLASMIDKVDRFCGAGPSDRVSEAEELYGASELELPDHLFDFGPLPVTEH